MRLRRKSRLPWMRLLRAWMALLHGLARDLHLHEGRRWQGLFKEVQRIIIIQDLDRVCQSQQLISTHLVVGLLLCLLGLAILCDINEELLVSLKVFCSVSQVFLLISQGDTSFT